MAAAQLRAPLYEDKVVDFLFEKADVTDRDVTREEIEAAIVSEEGFSTGTHSPDYDNHKPSQKSAAKKSTAKKAPSAKPKAANKAKAEAPANQAPSKAATSNDDKPHKQPTAKATTEAREHVK